MTFLQWIRSENNKKPILYNGKKQRIPMRRRLIGVLLIAEKLGTNPLYKDEVRFLIDELCKIEE